MAKSSNVDWSITWNKAPRTCNVPKKVPDQGPSRECCWVRMLCHSLDQRDLPQKDHSSRGRLVSPIQMAMASQLSHQTLQENITTNSAGLHPNFDPYRSTDGIFFKNVPNFFHAAASEISFSATATSFACCCTGDLGGRWHPQRRRRDTEGLDVLNMSICVSKSHFFCSFYPPSWCLS